MCGTTPERGARPVGSADRTKSSFGHALALTQSLSSERERSSDEVTLHRILRLKLTPP